MRTGLAISNKRVFKFTKKTQKECKQHTKPTKYQHKYNIYSKPMKYEQTYTYIIKPPKYNKSRRDVIGRGGPVRGRKDSHMFCWYVYSDVGLCY